MLINEIEFLKKLVQCKSITPENNSVLELCTDALQSLGFKVEILTFNDEFSYPVSNLYAKLGNGSNSLGFCGHLDVVPPGDETKWDTPPFAAEIQNNSIIGRGTEDMKGSIACFLYAISRIIPFFDVNSSTLVIMLTLDEESLAINGINKLIKYITIEKNLHLQGCLLGEPSCKNYVGDCIKIGRRGSLNFNISVLGKQGHVAYPTLFKNPIYTANSLIKEILNLDLSKRAENFELSNLEVTGLNSTSSVHNIVPSKIIVKGNIRFNTAYSLTELQKSITKLVNKYSNTTVEFLADASSPFISSTSSKLYKSLKDAIVHIVNKKPTNNTFGGTSDARFLKDYTQVIEFGLIEKTLHQTNEYVKLSELNTLTKIYTKFLQNYFNIL